MKKIVFLLTLFCFLSSFVFASEKEKLSQTDKVFYAFTGSAKIVLASWGFKQKDNYGTLTGIFFSLTAIRDVYFALRREK